MRGVVSLLVVIALMLTGFGGIIMSISENVEATKSRQTNLVGYWNLDDGSGSVASDNSGKGHDGAVINATWMNGVAGNALKFDGDGDWIQIPNSIDINFGAGEEFAISLWVKSDGTDSEQSLLSKRGNAGYQVWFNPGNEHFRIDEGATFTSVYFSFPFDNFWHNIVVMRNTTHVSVWIDGVLQNSTPDNTLADLTDTIDLSIGSEYLWAPSTMTGAIDDIKIYKSALTPSEISNNYDISWKNYIENESKIAYWHFDEGSGSVAKDSSGNDYDGTINGATWTKGVSGMALEFDGVDDYVGIMQSTKLDNINAFTFAAWIYPEIDSHWHVIDKGDGDKRLYADGTSLTLDGRVRYSGTHAFGESNSNTVVLNTWQHIMLTWSSSNNIARLYHNGVEVSYSSHTVGTQNALDDSSHPFTIGARGALGGGWSAGTFFDGIIDEVYIWSHALTSKEIQEYYKSFKNPATSPSAPQNLVASPGDGQVTLDWQPPVSNGGTAITNYRVYRGTSSGSNSYQVKLGNVITYTDTGVINGVTYYYNVTAINSVGESASSIEVTATPQAGPSAPSAPQNFVATAGDAKVTLNWQPPVSNGGVVITNYKIYKGTTSGSTTFQIKIGNVTTYTNTGLINGVTYYYNVTGVNSVGEGPTSLEVSVTPQTGLSVSSEPQNLIATPGDGQVTLNWQEPASDGGSTIMNYMIYRGTSSGGEALIATIGNVLVYADTGITNGQTYYYKVSAVNGVGEGTQSNELKVTLNATDDDGGDKGDEGDTEGTSTLLWPIIAIVVIIVIILIILVLYLARKPKASRPPKDGPEERVKPEAKEGINDNLESKPKKNLK